MIETIFLILQGWSSIEMQIETMPIRKLISDILVTKMDPEGMTHKFGSQSITDTIYTFFDVSNSYLKRVTSHLPFKV